MPIEVINTTFSDEFNTGTSTALNGNVSDIITATIDIEYSNIIDASSSSSYQITALDGGTLFSSKSGQQAFQFNAALISNISGEQKAELQNLTGAEITVSGFSGGSGLNGTYTIDSFNSAQSALFCTDAFVNNSNGNNAIIAVTEAITDCNLQYRFSGAGNNQDYSPAISLGSPQNTGLIPTFKTTNSPLDANSGTDTIPFLYNGAYQTGSMTIEGTGFSSNIQSFQIVHTTRATPISIYNSGQNEPNDYQAGILAINRVDNCFSEVTSRSKYGLLGTFSNQVNGGIEIDFNYEYNTGDIAVPSEKYGGGSSNYSFTNLSFVRTSDSEATSQPLIEEKFTVSFDIENSTDTPFSNSNTKVKVGIENLPDTIDNSKDYEQTFLSDYAITTLGAGAVAGSASGDALSISNYTATFNSTSSVTISFDVDFTTNAETQIKENGTRWISIYAETQDHLKDYTNSDRVVLNVYSGEATEKILSNPIVVDNTQFITAPYQDFSTGIDASEIDGFPVQLLAANTRFYADWSGREDLRLNSITQKLVLKNSSTLEEIELEGTTIPVNAFTLIDDTYPSANYSVLKGYKIPSNEVRNQIQMYNVSSLDVGDIHYYEVVFPFFIRWEDYTPLILQNIPSSIIDNNEPNDGVNYDVYRIDQLANWSLSYRVTFESSEGATLFEQDFDETLSTTTYNEHPDITSRDIRTFTEDGLTEITNLIESTENTLVSAEFTFSSAPSAISDFEIEIYIEAFENGSPTKIQRISSVNNLLSGSWFTDTGAGDGLIVKSIDGNKAIGKAYINTNTLVNYDNYRLYATIYNPKRPTEYILAENGDNLVAENGDKFIRDF